MGYCAWSANRLPHTAHGDCEGVLPELASGLQAIMDRQADQHARWHRALEDPDAEPDGPIRDHIRQALATAWRAGWLAMGQEHQRQRDDPTYPIGRDARNPYEDERCTDCKWVAERSLTDTNIRITLGRPCPRHEEHA